MPVFSSPPWERVVELLDDNDLPLVDLSADDMERFFGFGDPDRTDGVVGLEVHGDCVLLRSLVVADHARGSGAGQALTERAEGRARELGARAVYLLTDTAESFFRQLGYGVIDRDETPLAIRGTREFAELCPADSVVMRKWLA